VNKSRTKKKEGKEGAGTEREREAGRGEELLGRTRRK
jgi:hypothetical protein